MKRIILASASPRRRELLEQAGIAFEVLPSEGEEKTAKILPNEIAEDLALQKAREIYERTAGDRLVIGADTIVVQGEKIFGKPRDEREAVQMLTALQGSTHQVYTGVAFVYEREGKQEIRSFCECTDVFVYPMSPKEIAVYVATKEPMDKAGAYGIQGAFAAYIQKIQGDYNTVVGLPLGRLVFEMKKLEIM